MATSENRFTTLSGRRRDEPNRLWVLVLVVLGICSWSRVAVGVETTNAIVLPNFTIIGTRLDAQQSLWQSTNASAYPKQILIDYNPEGVAYGFACEYRIAESTNLFSQLQSAVNEQVKMSPQINQTNLVVWRNEERKFTVQLFHEEDGKIIRLIVISVDKQIRSK